MTSHQLETEKKRATAQKTTLLCRML